MSDFLDYLRNFCHVTILYLQKYNFFNIKFNLKEIIMKNMEKQTSTEKLEK